MKNLTTPQAILGGLALIALAIASIPYSSNIVTPAHAYGEKIQRVAICDTNGLYCADFTLDGELRTNDLIQNSTLERIRRNQ
jgi:hypothetical protein